MKLSYSVNSIRTNSIVESCLNIKKHGYMGVELCFSQDQFNPFELTEEKLYEIKQKLIEMEISPVAISTATTFFLSNIPHEPSIISSEESEREKRIGVIRQGIRVARSLNVPIVSFQSGYLRDCHESLKKSEVDQLITSSIRKILSSIEKDVA